MNYKWLKLFIVCVISVVCIAGCGKKSEKKAELDSVEITYELPEVTNANCRKLSESDESVYEQQIAACDMYYEAYYKTRTSDYKNKYKGDIKPKRIAYYCQNRRLELYDDI